MGNYRNLSFFLFGVLCTGYVVSQEGTNDNDADTNLMVGGGAETVQAIGICEEGSNCGFLTFDARPQENRYYKFAHYCNCPDGLECVRDRVDAEDRSFYFACRDIRTSGQPASESSDSSPEKRRDRSLSDESSQDSAESSKRFGYFSEEL